MVIFKFPTCLFLGYLSRLMDPWDWNIHYYMKPIHKFSRQSVGKYSSPMDPVWEVQYLCRPYIFAVAFSIRPPLWILDEPVAQPGQVSGQFKLQDQTWGKFIMTGQLVTPPPGHVNPDWLIAGVPYDQGFQWKPIGFPKKKGRLSSEGVCLGGWLTSHDLRVVHCLAGIWVCWSSLRFCLVGDLFMELYHGIHDHFSPPFGRICLELFSKHHGQAKSKFKSWEFEATPFPKDTAGQKFRDEKTTHTYFPIYRHPVILSWLGCPITSETNI